MTLAVAVSGGNDVGVDGDDGGGVSTTSWSQITQNCFWFISLVLLINFSLFFVCMAPSEPVGRLK